VGYGFSNAYNKRKPGVAFFSVSEAADAVSRVLVDCLQRPLVVVCMTSIYAQYSAKRGI